MRFAPADHRLPAGRVEEQDSSHVSPGIAALVPHYLNSKWKQIEEANAHLAAHDLDAVRRFGHNLRGTGRGYGFVRIEEIGCQIETAAMRGETAGVTEQLQQLRDFLAETSPAGGCP
jgi:HPt (histidine-containing phosphotransfer) domain-containing protein